jgi:hypothetical protein
MFALEHGRSLVTGRVHGSAFWNGEPWWVFVSSAMRNTHAKKNQLTRKAVISANSGTPIDEEKWAKSRDRYQALVQQCGAIAKKLQEAGIAAYRRDPR